jgi:signal transduction histidine kinase
MIKPDNDLTFAPRGTQSTLPQQQIYTESGINRATAIPIFSEATAQAIRLTEAPVAILSTISDSECKIASISGLDKFERLSGTGNLLSQLSGLEYCQNKAIGGTQSFIVTNFQEYPQLANSPLCQVHGVQAYLGLAIVTAAGDMLGAISILDFSPSRFTDRDLDIMQLIGQLAASEFERSCLSQAQLNQLMKQMRHQPIQGFDDESASSEYNAPTERLRHQTGAYLPTVNNYPSSIVVNQQTMLEPRSYANDRVRPLPTFEQHQLANPQAQAQGEIQVKLLAHLGQELRTPLTAVLGMARVLQQEIYGSLGVKQKDYLGIIHHSGLQLVKIVDEIVELGGFDQQHNQLNLKSVNLDLLCQLAIQSLEPLVAAKQQRIKLDLAGHNSSGEIQRDRLWVLDKDKVRQIIYYLSLSLIQSSATHHEITIRLANLTDRLQIQITTSDSQAMLVTPRSTGEAVPQPVLPSGDRSARETALLEQIRLLQYGSVAPTSPQPETDRDLRISLGLSLSQTLAAMHGGTIQVTPSGCGYRLSLPLILTEKS